MSRNKPKLEEKIEEPKISRAAAAEAKLAASEKVAVVEKAAEAGLDIFEKPNGDYIRLNRAEATLEAAEKLGWKKVE